MKTSYTSNMVLCALIALIGYQLYLGRQSIKGARQLSQTLTYQLDSLKRISNDLVILHRTYEGLYQDLHSSRAEVKALQLQLTQQASANILSVAQLREELHRMLAKYDTLSAPTISTTDDLSFQP